MNPKEIEKSIAERFSNLQSEIQDALMNTNYEKNLFKISKKYNLTPKQLNKLELNTTLVMLGNIHPNEYLEDLIDDLKIQKDKATLIETDIKEGIGENIWQMLKDNFDEEDRKEAIIINEIKKTKRELGIEADEIPVPLPPKKEQTLLTPENKKRDKIKAPPINLPIASTKSNTEEKNTATMSNAGVEILDKKPLINKEKIEKSKMTLNEDSLLVKEGIDVIEDKPTKEREHFLPNKITQKEVLEGIEHPQNINPNIIHQKLQGAVINSAKVSDHTLSKNTVNNNSSTGLKKDSYRENV